MDTSVAQATTRILQSTARITAIVTIVVGSLVLIGWILGVSSLTSVVAGLPTMKANTAFCFVVAGSSLLLLSVVDSTAMSKNSIPQRGAIVLAGGLILIAGITLSEYLLHWDAGLDQFLIQAPKTDAAMPGRMSVATALEFTLLGCALLLMAASQRFIAMAQSIAVLSALISMLALYAYLFNAELTRVFWFSSVALHTALTFFIVSTGILMLRADSGWMQVFFHQTNSAKLGRKFLLGTLLLLPVVSELLIIGQRNFDLYGPYFGIAIFTVASSIVLSILNWFSTREGSRADAEIYHLNRVYAVLSGINTLIVRVHDKDALFKESCQIAGDVGKYPWAWIATIDAQKKI